jgi:tRNA dimethylallyltransferase
MSSGRPSDAAPRSIVAIVGPTAVGKSALAIRLAEELGAEIVGADSRQVYRRMDIGTAKATPDERRRVPHHLLDLVEPDERYDLARFQADAYAAIDQTLARGRLPLLVGGTGLYVRAVLEGYALPLVPPAPGLRRELERRADLLGPAALHRELATLNPSAAERLDARNVRRVIRAIEVALSEAPAPSRASPRYRTLRLGLTMPRPALSARIDRRVEAMLARGLIGEVAALLADGYGRDLPSMSGIGYRQIAAYLAGERSLTAAVDEIKFATHRFARQQATWFRTDDPRIVWLPLEPDPLAAALQTIEAFARM